MLHRFMPQLSRSYLRRLGDELFHGHVQVIQTVKVHLRLVKLVLEIETLLDKLKLYKRRYDLTRR